jgi:hypothetical protein
MNYAVASYIQNLKDVHCLGKIYGVIGKIRVHAGLQISVRLLFDVAVVQIVK